MARSRRRIRRTRFVPASGEARSTPVRPPSRIARRDPCQCLMEWRTRSIPRVREATPVRRRPARHEDRHAALTGWRAGGTRHNEPCRTNQARRAGTGTIRTARRAESVRRKKPRARPPSARTTVAVRPAGGCERRAIACPRRRRRVLPFGSTRIVFAARRSFPSPSLHARTGRIHGTYRRYKTPFGTR